MNNKLLKRGYELEIFMGIILLVPGMMHYLGNIFNSLGIGISGLIFTPIVMFAAVVIFIDAFRKNAHMAFVVMLVVMLLLKIAEFFTVGRIYLYGREGWYDFLKSPGYTLLFLALPVYASIFCVDRQIDIPGKLLYLCDIVICMQVFLFYLSLTGNKYSVEHDYMSYAYFGIFASFVVFFKRKKSVVQTVLCILSCIMMLVAGCRGAALSILIFILLYTVLKTDLSKTNNVIALLFGILILVLFIVNFNEILTFVSEKLSAIGFESRTLNKALESDDFFVSEGRNEIQKGIFEKITFFGRGIYGDRVIVENHAYVHNWMLEFLIDFGYIFGSVLIVYVLWLVISTFVYVKKTQRDDLIFLISSAIAFVFGKYMFSASFLSSSEFMYSIFVLLYIRKIKNRKIK